jgi:hypothetical protein
VWRDAIPGLPESACPEMVTIPPGKFLMGEPASEALDAERPPHEVRIDYAFARRMGRGCRRRRQAGKARPISPG